MDIHEKYNIAKEFCECYEAAQNYDECKNMFTELFRLIKSLGSFDKFLPSEKNKFEDYNKKLSSSSNEIIISIKE